MSVEDPKKREHVVKMVKPKVEKAIAVKVRPVQQQVAKVKSYEWNKHQSKLSVGGNIVKPHSTTRYLASESSIDIFQSNKLLDQTKMFAEFDALFDKSKESEKLPRPTPESAFSKLNAFFAAQDFDMMAMKPLKKESILEEDERDCPKGPEFIVNSVSETKILDISVDHKVTVITSRL